MGLIKKLEHFPSLYPYLFLLNGMKTNQILIHGALHSLQ